MSYDLTGKIGYRVGFFGKLILRVETRHSYYARDNVLEWRDATQDDANVLQLSATFKPAPRETPPETPERKP